ncbi:MAG: hypothetical protein WDM85_16430 [Caulobacteraceae bacterium]
MNGVHDMGGTHGLGPIAPEPDEPVFHADWERRVHALVIASPTRGNIDAGRHQRELIPGPDYLRMTYYEKWFSALREMLLKGGAVTAEELGSVAADPSAPRATPRLAPEMVAPAQSRSGSYLREPASAPAFEAGDKVRARNLSPTGHTPPAALCARPARGNRAQSRRARLFPTATPTAPAKTHGRSTPSASPPANFGGRTRPSATASASTCGSPTLSASKALALPGIPRDADGPVFQRALASAGLRPGGASERRGRVHLAEWAEALARGTGRRSDRRWLALLRALGRRAGGADRPARLRRRRRDGGAQGRMGRGLSATPRTANRSSCPRRSRLQRDSEVLSARWSARPTSGFRRPWRRACAKRCPEST